MTWDVKERRKTQIYYLLKTEEDSDCDRYYYLGLIVFLQQWIC